MPRKKSKTANEADASSASLAVLSSPSAGVSPPQPIVKKKRRPYKKRIDLALDTLSNDVSPPSSPSSPRERFEGSSESQTVIVKTGYDPRPEQLAIHEDSHRFKVVVAHRRLGKTTAALNELILHAVELKPGKRFWYIAPTYRQAKMIAMRDLKQFLPGELIVKKNENELVFELFNGSEIALKGADNEDSLRGAGLAGVVFDEYQKMDKSVWEAVIRPTLAEEGGWAIFLGTPNGRNHFYELFQKGQSPEFVDWKSFHWSVLETNLFPAEFVEQEKKENTQEYFRQEWMAEFLEGSGTVFRNILKSVGLPLPVGGLPPKWDETYQVGADIARYHDWTVFTVVNHKGEVVYWNRFQQLDWEIQKLKLLHLSEVYHHAPIILDATGVGDPILDDLQAMGANIHGYKINSSSQKKALIENLQIRIEQCQAHLPNEPQMIHELESFSYEIADSGRIKYRVPQGFHDDCVMSLALAFWDLPVYQGRNRPVDRYLPYEDDF